MKKCALYLRVSTNLQREKNTIASQKTILPKLIKTHGYTLYKSYIDDGISGETIEDRPAFQSLLADASTDCFEAVAVIDFDRLTRATDLTQLALIKKIFKDANIKVITPNTIFDFQNEDQDFMSDLFGILAKHEKRKILARTKRGIKEKMRQGKWIMGRVPTPYYRDRDGIVQVNEDKKIQILSILNDSKVMGRSRVSKKHGLYQSSLRRIISPKRLLFYAGYLEVDGDHIKGQWPPIITKEERLDILQGVEERFNERKHPAHKYLLTSMGFFKCQCGYAVGSHTFTRIRRERSNMSAPPRLYRRGYYRCNNRKCEYRHKVRSSETIDELVIDRLQFQINRLNIISDYIAQLNQTDTTKSQIKATRSQISTEEKKKHNLVKAISEGVLEFEDARNQLDTIKKRIENYRKTVESLTQISGVIKQEVVTILKGVRVDQLEFDEKRSAIQACIQKLVLTENNLFIYYRFPINEKGNNKYQVKLG